MSSILQVPIVMDLLLYVLPLLLAYVLILYLLSRKGYFAEGKPLGLLGPILMWKTPRGRAFLDRLGRYKRFWNAFGDVGIALALVGMVAMFVILAWGAWRATYVSKAQAPPLTEVVTIPGLNPLLPLGYGLLALIVAVVLHELCHGVLARANGIRVKSLGVLFLVLPLGAFVEQDEEDMTKAPARQRDRVAAAGVMANFVLAMIFFLIMAGLLASSVHVKADGVGVLGIIAGTPAANSTTSLGPDGLSVGDIVTSLNGTPTPTTQALNLSIAATHPGENVPIQWYSQAAGGIVASNVTLASALHFLPSLTGDTSIFTNNPWRVAYLRNVSFVGVSETVIPPSMLLSILTVGPAAQGTAPLLGMSSSSPGADLFSSTLLFIALPVTYELPIQGTIAQFYSVSGPLSVFGVGGTFVIVNALYWLVWVDLLLGVFNALPAVPLDGGFLFRDLAAGLVKRVRPKWPSAQMDRAVNAMLTFATLVVFFLILWEVLVPQL